MWKKTLSAALMLSASMTFAQPPERTGGDGAQSQVDRMFNFDENKDNKLSKEEVPERLQTMFGRADKNEDGFLTRDELAADFRSREGQDSPENRPNGEGRGEGEGRGREGGGREGGGRGGFGGPGMGPGPGGMPPFPVMMALDANKDGEISADEINNATAALKKLDRNLNGKLDRDELMPDFGGRGGFGGGTGGQGQGFGGGNMATFLLERYDADKDGKLTGDEIPERMRERAESADTNKDKSLDKAELEAMGRQAFGGGRGGFGGGGNREGSGRPQGDGEGRRRPESE